MSCISIFTDPFMNEEKDDGSFFGTIYPSGCTFTAKGSWFYTMALSWNRGDVV